MNEKSPPPQREALKKLTSPEQLDRLLVIIRPPGWIGLLCFSLLILILLLWSCFGRLSITIDSPGIFYDPRAIELIQSLVTGVVEEVMVKGGSVVNKGDLLARLKIENLQTEKQDKEENVLAPRDGTILEVDVLKGETVQFGTNLMWFQDSLVGRHQYVYAFFPLKLGSQIVPGMKADIAFDAVSSTLYGKMTGVVKEVHPFATSQQGDVLKSLPSTSLRHYLSQEEATILVLIDPVEDRTAVSGYKWTTKKGPPFKVNTGSVAQITVFLKEKRPINYLIPIGQ